MRLIWICDTTFETALKHVAAPTLLHCGSGVLWVVCNIQLEMKFNLGFVRPRQTFLFMVLGDFTSLDEGYHVVVKGSVHNFLVEAFRITSYAGHQGL